MGYLFVALKGERVDGHDFLRDAAKQGAVAALVLERYEGEDFGLILIRVPNVLVALQTMAKKRLDCFLFVNYQNPLISTFKTAS